MSSFFERSVKRRNLRWQIAIATVAGIAFAFDMGSLYMQLGEAQPVYGGVALILSVMYAFLPIVVWAGSTLVIHTISRFIGAETQYTVLLRVTGWGMVPFIGSGILLGVGRYMAIAGVNSCSYLSCDPIARIELTDQVDQLYGFMALTASNDLFLAFSAIAILLMLVMGYLWLIAVEKTTALTKAGATVAVLPAMIAVIAIMVATIY